MTTEALVDCKMKAFELHKKVWVLYKKVSELRMMVWVLQTVV